MAKVFFEYIYKILFNPWKFSKPNNISLKTPLKYGFASPGAKWWRDWSREFSKKRNEVRLTVRRRVCLITFRFSSHVLMSTPIISLKCMSHCHMANNNTFLIGDHAWDITGWWQVLATQTHRMTTWNIWLKENFFNFWIPYCNRTQQIEGYGVECKWQILSCECFLAFISPERLKRAAD